jgi:dTDP-4-amino-4,6-dideoxygalactose transaminase
MGKLAVFGGEPAVTEGLVKAWPNVTDDDKAAVMAVLDRGVLWGEDSPETVSLEREWSHYIGTKYCLATNSGTAALHMAVAAAGVGPGDEVITSALTFLASASCILHQNGVPVFADVDPDTFNVTADSIKERITERTKAIIPVHLHGLPADMEEILELGRKHGLAVIEDACQAHGATYKSRKVGSLGESAAFSLNTTKNLAGGEGGLFNTDDEAKYVKAKSIRTFGEVLVKGEQRTYNAHGMGWMYRTQEISAALARSGLRRLDAENHLRVQNAQYLSRELAQIPGVIPPKTPPDRTHVYHLYRFKLDPSACGVEVEPALFRDRVMRALQAEGVSAFPWQTLPVPGQTLFQKLEGYGGGCPWSCHMYKVRVNYDPAEYPITRRVLASSLVIHSAIYPPNGTPALRAYVDAFHKVFQNVHELARIEIEAQPAMF